MEELNNEVKKWEKYLDDDLLNQNFKFNVNKLDEENYLDKISDLYEAEKIMKVILSKTELLNTKSKDINIKTLLKDLNSSYDKIIKLLSNMKTKLKDVSV